MVKQAFTKKLLLLTIVSSLIIGIFLVDTLPSSPANAKTDYHNGKVKNVIFMIPDGFSSSYATNYRWYKGEESVMDSMLVGMMKTHSANSEVTDSAAAGTAMATGEKTNNGMISISPDGKELYTILEAAEDKGKATGLVATSTITHATPAVFASHVASRSNEEEIAPQLIENDVDVLLGGGKKFFSESLLEKAQKDGYKLVENRDKLANVQKTETDKLIGLFADNGMAPELDRDETDEPSLAEMTRKAIEVLQNNKNGFFLMVEGSQIDWAGHAHDPAWAMKDVEAFEKALQEAIHFAEMDQNTLVIVAGDHDTGGMSVGGYGKSSANIDILRNVTATGDFMASELNANRSNAHDIVKKYTNIDLTDKEVNRIIEAEKPATAINEIISERAIIGWTSTGHTGTDVPLYAFGPSSSLFSGLHDNTDLPKLIAKAMKIAF